MLLLKFILSKYLARSADPGTARGRIASTDGMAWRPWHGMHGCASTREARRGRPDAEL